MHPAKKVAFNTFVLYTKIFVTMAISLVSVPLVLKALGASDYGLYHLVAGVVAMLSFLNNSMTVSSQRYMSVSMGTGNKVRVNEVFNASFIIHLFLGLTVVLLLECGSFFIYKLNIEPDRIGAAQIIYQFLILSTFNKIIIVPFNALTNAHEDMLAFSVIDIIDSLLMLLLAFSLRFLPSDKLVFYGFGVLLLSLINYLLMQGWTHYAYKDYKISLRRLSDKALVKEMFGFSGWNILGGIAVIGRNQGVAVIINMFLGTTVNAAYGVANQINGAMLHFSSTFQKAINPQLMKSEGMNDRRRLHRISFISSKFSVLALCVFAVPFIIEMDEILQLWLGDSIPPFTLRLSQCILLFSIVYQYSSGLMSSIQATGNIRNYQIIISGIILMNLPLCFIFLKMGYPVYYVTMGYVVMEIISLIVRILIARKITEMDINEYVENVIRPTIIIIGVSTLACLVPHLLLTSGVLRLILTWIVYFIFYTILMWFVGFDNYLRITIEDWLKVRLHRNQK